MGQTSSWKSFEKSWPRREISSSDERSTRKASSTVEKPSLDCLLELLENPVRRRIVRLLSQEPSYPLQLSKELGLSQQLVAKHLEIMEKTGIVSSTMNPSPNGPERRLYLLKNSVSISLDFAPNLFNEKLVFFDGLSEKDLSQPATKFMGRLEGIIQDPKQDGSVSSYGNLLSDLDMKIGKLDDERTVLIYIRNLANEERI